MPQPAKAVERATEWDGAAPGVLADRSLRYDESKYASYLEQLGVKYPPEE